MSTWYWNGAGERFPLPERELEPPEARTEGRATMAKEKIANMEEVNAFWSGVLRDEGEDMRFRLKASELRAKSAGSLEGKVKALEKAPAPVIPLSRRLALLREIAAEAGGDEEAGGE